MQKLKRCVVAVQAQPCWLPTPDALSTRLLELLDSGAMAEAMLVALPALLGWALVGPVLGLPLAAPYALSALPLGDLTSNGVIDALQWAMNGTLGVFSDLARSLGVWLVGGSMPRLGPSGELCHATPIFDPQGRERAWQVQTHLSSGDSNLGLTAGEDLVVIDVGVGRLGLLLCDDVLYPEVSRILCLLGANVLVHQGAWQQSNRAQWMSRLWREVQANQVFGLESVLAGGGYRGRATVHAPCEMTPDTRGVLAQANREDEDELVGAVLDRQALQVVVEGYPIYGMMNRDLSRRYLPHLYDGGAVS